MSAIFSFSPSLTIEFGSTQLVVGASAPQKSSTLKFSRKLYHHKTALKMEPLTRSQWSMLQAFKQAPAVVVIHNMK